MSSVPTGFRRREWAAALGLLALLALLAHGPWLTRLGFYRDDWYVLWAGAVHGPQSIVTMFSIDRPLVGYLFAQTYAWFGDNALAWHAYALGLRWLTAALSLVLLRGIWPKRLLATTAAAALMLVYPGFLQQPNGMTFSNQLTTYVVALLSITFTMLAVRSRRSWVSVALTVAALVTALIYQLLYEYMIGLEAARLLVLWFLSPPEARVRGRLRWIGGRWLPYLLLSFLQIVWRSAFFQSERGATDLAGVAQAYLAQPVRLAAAQTFELVKDVVDIVLAGWAVPFYQLTSSADLRSIALAFLLGGIGLAVCLGYGAWTERRRRSLEPDAAGAVEHDGRQMAVAGAVLIVLGQIPLIFAFRDVRWGNGYDRYTLQATLAAALLTVGLLWAFTRPAFRRMVVVGLVALALVTNYLNASHWASFWEAQRQLWWQLSWRAPDIAPGTVLLADLPVDGFYEDYEVWGPANLIFAGRSPTVQIGSEVFTESTAEKVRFGVAELRGMRAIVSYRRDFNDVLIASRPSQASCLHVLDGRRPEYPVGADGLVRSVAAFSDIGRIETDAATGRVVPDLFGPEPAHSWCYFYQQASLARQRGDWPEVVRLGDEVERQELRPADRSEWLPFLEGYAVAGRLPEAIVIARRIRDQENIRHELCDRIAGTPSAGVSESIHREILRLLCEFE